MKISHKYGIAFMLIAIFGAVQDPESKILHALTFIVGLAVFVFELFDFQIEDWFVVEKIEPEKEKINEN